MKRLITILCLGLAALGLFGAAHEQSAASDAASAVEAAASAVQAAAAPAAAPEAAATPVPDKGDVSWMLVSTLLVIMMAIPGLALFYGGLVRSKNMLSVLMQVFVTFSLITVLWVVYGYSLAFTEGNAFIGGFDRLFLNGVFDPATGSFAMGATFSKGVVIPEIVFVAFQATFAAITFGLIVGAFAERIKFSAVLLFMAIWFTFSYTPIAHMVWFWMGPDAYASKEVVDELNGKAGLIWQWGALDFAGGTVVHINAAVAGLVGAYMLGKRVGYGREAMAPHNLPMTMIGASMLWVGWFGFNVGSGLAANGTAGLVMINTQVATAAAVLGWVLIEWLTKGKPSMLGGASGAIAGLVAITPACAFVGPFGAIVLGFVASIVSFWAVTSLKSMLGYDDSLDVFGIHGIAGIIGAIGVGVLAAPGFGGVGFAEGVTMGSQLYVQVLSVVVTIVWCGVVSYILYKIVDLLIGLRVTEEAEREGLDTTEHGERAYHY